MKKENGRLSPADKKEVSEVKQKLARCSGCNMIVVLQNKVFGKEDKCEICGGLLEDFIVEDY